MELVDTLRGGEAEGETESELPGPAGAEAS